MSVNKFECFLNKKLKILGQIKPQSFFWLKINFRKIASNKHDNLRKIENSGTAIFKEHLCSEQKIQYFWNKKSKGLDEINHASFSDWR